MPRRLIHTVGVALAVTAVVAAPAIAQQQDRTSPDAAPAIAYQQDRTSPDAPAIVHQQDRTSPDAAPQSGVPVKVVVPAPGVPQVDKGFDWRYAGIGAAVLFALALLVMSGSAIVRRHKPAMVEHS